MTNKISVMTPGGNIEFEVDQPTSLIGEVANRNILPLSPNIADLSSRISEVVLASYNSVASAAQVALSAQSGAPRRVDVEFGVKIGAEGNVFVAKGTTEANVTIKFSWGS